MKSFVSNELEPFAYIIYMLAVILYYYRFKLFRHKVLAIYNAGAAVLLYVGIVASKNNYWSYNLLFFINICVSSWYFRLLYQNDKKNITVFCWILNALLFVYVNIIESKFDKYNNAVYAVSFISLVLYSLFYLHQLLVNVKEENLLLNFDFWLVCGFLLYFLGSFIIVLYYDHNKLVSQRGDLWAMHDIILFICSVITLFASLIIVKKTKRSG